MFSPFDMYPARHLLNSFWRRIEGVFYTATLDHSRRDVQGRAQWVVKADGREIGAKPTMPQARDLIIARVEGSALAVAA